MKLLKIFVILNFAFFLLLTACDKEPQEKGPTLITGELISDTGCKSFGKSVSLEDEKPDTLSCIEYSFDETTRVLSINHINAGFNCCPESLYCSVSCHEDTILIEEHETEGLCDCLCLFDLEIEVAGVVPGEYVIQVIEPYNHEEEELVFNVNLESQKEGAYCAVRKKYPW
ncbi:MAG: hypothetical protein JW798_04175 [Prolixibacteraceae bacterium]|nr:hypothetical protein [Prolixibacteraceae bacterium]